MTALWTMLQTTPLLWLAVTLLVFEGADRLSVRSKRHPLCHPVLTATPVLILVLLATRTPYPVYARNTAMLSFLLGPATVGLAVPLWRNRALVRSAAAPLLLALFAGSLTAILSVTAIVWAFGGSAAILATVAPRSVTTPVAMALAQQLGGIPALAAIVVLIAGVFGAMIATPVLNALRIEDCRVRGFATGVAAHGIGMARAFQVSELGGTFAGIGMALNAAMTALLLTLWAVL
ncbi:Inner membrane protein YohK [Sphingomonas sp. S2M10]|uniref:LrgB family protein n=1 Tax=Sphingomonas sp. S2M10 TaxID=2705010 RepID=UPI0014569588|nr:LrgB family protein [Sphingomonas sp. S2M10]NLS25977.1 Inner membrane protein YohK [Sphingomonas sp. S2M10]